MDDWRFDQARDVAAVTSAAVLAGAPILLVVHYSDEDWGFFDGAPLDTANGRVIGMGEAVSLDPSLNEVADLPPGHVARRSTPGAPWIREPDAEV